MAVLESNAITIVTPCSRPNNLSAMASSIQSGRKLFNLIWMVILDGGEHPNSVFGNQQRNDALNTITSGWVYFLDDDNLIHPDFFSILLDAIKEQPNVQGFAFDQIMQNGKIRLLASPDTMHVGHIDMAQVCMRRKLIGDIRFYPSRYESDGIFIEAIYQSNPKVWKFINKPLCYYNELRES